MGSTAGVDTDGGNKPPSVKVWDPFVRIFHWSLVTAFAVAFVSADEWDIVHEWAGYTAAALVGSRVIWGLVGTEHARFSSFVRGPSTTLEYLRDIISGRERRYLGHNPAGGVMVLALLCGIVGLGATGYLMTMTRFGDADWLEDIHEAIANGMLVLVTLHVAGVVFTSLRHGENLVRAMVTGRKRAA